MVFKLESLGDPLVDGFCREGVKKLELFFDFKWTRNRPLIFIVKDREMVDKLKGEKTFSWLVAWVKNDIIYLLDRKNFEKESDHKYSEAEYKALIAHEICHIYYAYISGDSRRPVWLNEGFSIYLSGQTGLRKRPAKFEEFLDFYDTNATVERTVYKEAGFVVEHLIKYFGKEKLIKLIKQSKDYPSKQSFDLLFEQIYKFKLNYKNFNISK